MCTCLFDTREYSVASCNRADYFTGSARMRGQILKDITMYEQLMSPSVFTPSVKLASETFCKGHLSYFDNN